MARKMWRGDVTVMKVLNESMIVDYEGEEGFVPLSQIDEDSEITASSKKGDSGTLVIPEWLAEDRGWA